MLSFKRLWRISMSTIYEESGLVFDFSAAKSIERADKQNIQGLSLVDFIFETDSEYIFIEIKNGDNIHARKEGREKFLKDLALDTYPLKMAMKFKDSLLKEVVSGAYFAKPILYLILLEFSVFDANQRKILLNKIREHIPIFKECEYKAVARITFAGIKTLIDFNRDFPNFPCTMKNQDDSSGNR